MTTSIQIELKDDIAIARCTGVLRASDAREGAKALWRTPGWNGQPVVWDFRQARFDLSSAEAKGIAKYVLASQPASPPSRVAFVTARDVDFGMARVFEAYRDDPRTEFRVFRDYGEAIQWALRQDPEGRPTSRFS